MAKLVQWAGCMACDPNSSGLFLMMVELFALDLPSDTLNWLDPDELYAGNLKGNLSKQDQTSIASIQYAQLKTCLHEFFARYLGDKSSQGKVPFEHIFPPKYILALELTSLWYCDCHHNTNFDLTWFFHGQLWTGVVSPSDSNSNSKPRKWKWNQIHPIDKWQAFLDLLVDWQEQAWE